MLDSIDNGPLVYPTVEEDGQTRPKKYLELTEAQQLQDNCDVQATNIILYGLPPDVYALVNHQEAAKDIWEKGETLYEYYWIFSQLINDMHTIGMTMQQVQVNTKFLNALPPKWSKFVTNVKLAKSLYTTNYDQLLPPSNNQLRMSYNPINQTEDLDAYDSDCDDISSAKAILMENLSSCDSHILFEDTNSSIPNDLLVLLLVEQMPDHVANLDKENQTIKCVIPKEHDVIYVIDDEETLILEEESRSKMLDKQNKRRLCLKKLKYHLTGFDKVVKKRTTSDAITAGAWGFEHKKACLVTEIILFLKVLKDTFNAVDKTLLDEITKVQTIFNQMEAAVD
nr:hypothetical protein [Tanacetum cinerariifolium]